MDPSVPVFSIANGNNIKAGGVGKDQRYSMYWTLEKEILLIKYFEEHRYMWDTNHILFHKREPRIQGFADLVELLGIDEGTIRQRWSSMRSQFCREERKVALCPTYIPTWDHYNALQFLRKPFEEPQMNPFVAGTLVPAPQYEDNEDAAEYEDSPSNHEHELDDENVPSGFRLSQIADQLAGRLMTQPESYSHHYEEEKQNSDTVTTGTSPPLDIKAELLNEAHFPTVMGQPPTQRQLVRKCRTPRQRRWTPAYNRKYQEISTSASASINSGPLMVEQPRIPSENDAFIGYISSVLERFPPDQQRRCRNELLCIILKYDNLEEDGVRPPSSHD